MLRKISKNGKTIKYVKDKKETPNYLPAGAPDEVRYEPETEATIMVYDSGEFRLENVDKKFGNHAGDVCPVCQAGEMSEFGGCATCNNCGAQLKCGL